jgi:hypothetical protein
MEGAHIIFKEGALQKAVKSGKPLVIHQGLWGDEEFLLFWDQAKLYGRIEHSGGLIEIPDSLELVRDDGYDWKTLSQNIKGNETFDTQAQILNPSTFTQFFSHYTCDKASNTLSYLPGFIETCPKGTSLSVYVTRALTENQWAMLGAVCNAHKITLLIHPAPGVIVPAELQLSLPETKPVVSSWDIEPVLAQNTLIISSTDIDATIAMMTAEDLEWQVFDVSACRGRDLLTNVRASFTPETLSFQFSQEKRALLKALEGGKKVILKGIFSSELLDELAPLLQQRMSDGKGRASLVLVGGDLSVGHYREFTTHQVCVADKKSCLALHFSVEELSQLSDERIEKESFSQLRARLVHQRIHPGKSSDDAWLGLLVAPPIPKLAPLNELDDSKALAQAFNEERKKNVLNTLNYAPYVYLTGLTGVGKTTFVEKYLQSDPAIALHSGANALKQWATDTSPGTMKLLFRDEVNLSHLPASDLEGLFDIPPGILIEGQYYPLTSEHKAIVAGNPLSYGDERHLSPTFAQHGNALLFEPLPLASIYEEILKPMFANTPLAKDSWALFQPFFEVYRFLLENSQEELLISPRELQMMAALVVSHNARVPQDNGVEAAHYYAYQITKNLVPEIHLDAFLALPSIAKARDITLNNLKASGESGLSFLLTPSRQPIAQQLTDLLALSELRKSKAQHYNKAQLYGGLGGVVLTGYPGVGKSELVLAVLRQNGYRERRFKPQLNGQSTEHSSGSHKIFYRMPVSLPLKVKQQLILKAFNEGAVLLADEINSSPMLEEWFNDLLMGKHPITQAPPKTPGFCLIGTQNPVSLSGRRRASPASSRRLVQITVPPYSNEEMYNILIQKGVHPLRAEHLVSLFENKLAYAQEHQLKPPPTFRDLLKAAGLAKDAQMLKAPMLSLEEQYEQCLESLEDTITGLQPGTIKDGAVCIKEIIRQLKSAGEPNLAPYLTITEQLLTATAEKRQNVLSQFQQKLAEAHGHPSPLWQQLGTAMLILAGIVALATGIAACATGLAIIPLVGMAISAASLLGTSIGFFASNRPQGLAKAMTELEHHMGHEELVGDTVQLMACN